MKPQWIVFAEDWGRHPSSSQHIMQQMMRHHSVHWINSIGLRRPSFAWRDCKRIWEKLKQPKRHEQHSALPQPTQIYAPKVWPLAQWSWLKTWNNHQLKALAQLPKHYPRIVWAALPSAVDYLDPLDADLVIYYCGDDFSALAGVDHARVAAKERALVEKADLILAASPALAQRFPATKTQILTHGVDLDSFAPNPAIHIEPNVIGFYGSLNQWLDQHLLCQLAEQFPQYQFELVGRIDCTIHQLRAHRNIHLYPAQPHEQLPDLLARWQIAILPFKDNRQIQACNPLKLREYLASGTAVISSDFAAARDFTPWVHIANTPTDWFQCITQHFHHQQQQPSRYKSLSTQLQQRLQQESWHNKGQLVMEHICKQLKKH
ncbi:hypothetical protein VST7929_02440 [Vibrio stylophorae]|uniref:Glycosyl transferase family 1 domain-containing protein n=1 Tax=Vibrio stylophorae TaxID=659351 RepID=A0ABM8ZVY0_9VIBR|nr:glycosyltransferase [Vibrio stylophorae]CAH0534497.1 hypothetical protein VST7929_02440 [Vibrio stylophorae]